MSSKNAIPSARDAAREERREIAPAVTGHQRVIAIDGPAAAGKSTVARLLADRLGALLFDTGAFYRAVALAALRSGLSAENEQALARWLAMLGFRFAPFNCRRRLYDVWLNGEDVTWSVRDPEVGAIVSRVAEHPAVRAALLPLQRTIASGGPVVMVGRDIGTVVVPDAGLKVYLDATPEERARRRFREAAAGVAARVSRRCYARRCSEMRLTAAGTPRRYGPPGCCPDQHRRCPHRPNR